jgi:arylsulfatase A-like enzyme
MSWSPDDNPCVPFQTVDRAEDCRLRQTACVEYIDEKIQPLLERFSDASVLACADHGDCWGEDGLWEHGISHEMTLTVPLIIRLAA